MNNYPWVFISYWVFGVLAFIYLFDASMDYVARIRYRSIRRKSSTFLQRMSGKSWTRTSKPSVWYILLIPVPPILCGFLYILLHLIFPVLPTAAELIIGLFLVGIACFASNWICDYKTPNIVYIGYALIMAVHILARVLWFNELTGFGFNNLLTSAIAVWCALFAVYMAYDYAKFNPIKQKGDTDDEHKGRRMLFGANFVQILLGVILSFITTYVLFLKPILNS